MPPVLNIRYVQEMFERKAMATNDMNILHYICFLQINCMMQNLP